MKFVLTLGVGFIFGVWPIAPAFAVTATSLKSFEGIEEPTIKYILDDDKFEQDDFVNITDQGNGVVRMTLRYRAGQWWDGDRDRKEKDRQRAEVKGLGPHQKLGDTFAYGTTWRTDPNFQGGDRFCHIFQLKALNGDNGAPLVTLSILPGLGNACVHYWSGNSKGFVMVRQFTWQPATWETVKIRIKTSKDADGFILVSVNGDDFKGVQNVSVYRPEGDEYRPKWGLYRGVDAKMPFGDDYIEHKNASAEKL
ncbi:MAG TPA: heparin lyase I family protein [Candidatus Methylacidiphilales bacterium]|nr:heparin lyase I family protein [Candidatus Methylacidiphilales bacterium]